jgi:hypothetical protein
VLVSKQSTHCSQTRPFEDLVRLPLSQGISSLEVDERTLPQNLEHGESGATSSDAASGADTATAMERRGTLARISVVRTSLPFNGDYTRVSME